MSLKSPVRLTKKRVLSGLQHVIDDCYNHENWETMGPDAYHNFESMASLCEDAQAYISRLVRSSKQKKKK